VRHHAAVAAGAPDARGGFGIAAGTDQHQHEIGLIDVTQQPHDVGVRGGIEIDHFDRPMRVGRLQTEQRHTDAGATPGCAISASRAASLNG